MGSFVELRPFHSETPIMRPPKKRFSAPKIHDETCEKPNWGPLFRINLLQKWPIKLEPLAAFLSVGVMPHLTREWWTMEPTYSTLRFVSVIGSTPNHHPLTYGEVFGSLGFSTKIRATTLPTSKGNLFRVCISKKVVHLGQQTVKGGKSFWIYI